MMGRMTDLRANAPRSTPATLDEVKLMQAHRIEAHAQRNWRDELALKVLKAVCRELRRGKLERGGD
jgi:hypothetical protein